MVSKCVLAFLLVTVIGVCSAGGGGSHHKIVIHVPYTVKHHHHTHTIYKHIKEEKKEHKEPEHEHIHEHIHEHPHEEEGKDHYELLGYTYGKSKHEESGKESQGHKGFGGSSHEHKFSGGSSKHNGGLFGSHHSFGESKTSANHEKKGLGHFGPGHGRLISDYVGKLSGQSSFNHERASSIDESAQGFEKHGEIVKSNDGSHSSQFFGSKAGYDLLMKQGNSLGHSVDLEI